MLAVLAAALLQTGSLANGSFDQGLNSWVQASYGGKPSVTVHESEHGKAVTIESKEPTDTAFGQDVAVIPGQFYRLTGWVETRDLKPNSAPVFGTIQAQSNGAILASGVNHEGITGWTKETVYFAGPPSGFAHICLFFCGWGRGTGTAEFADLKLEPVDPANSSLKITTRPLVPGRINPFQYGQFIEYLCDLVPGMWAEKLDDGSFVGLSPYKFVFSKDTDCKEKPWSAVGLEASLDTTMSVAGTATEHIVLPGDPPLAGGIGQEGVSVDKGVPCKFSIYCRSAKPGAHLHVALLKGDQVLAKEDVIAGKDWGRSSTLLTPTATATNAVLAITIDAPSEFWLHNASLMPKNSIGGWRPDVFAALKALKPGIIRVGGSVMDDANLGTFEWKDTIGDPDKRTPFRAWGGLQQTGAGLEELVQLIQGVGAEPLICIRYEKKTPQDAAEEVEYFNGATTTKMGALRAKNGHPKPYGIKYWQIGNERWGEAYWKAVPAFAKAIRAVDPTVKLLSSFPSQQLIELAKDDIDYVSPHQYDIADLGGTKRELEQTRSLISRFGKGQKVGVTEWNTTAGDAGPGRAKLWNLANALACSRYQNLLHREADLVEIANRSNLTNSFCSGIIQTDRSRMYLTPTYYAQQLYATLAGTRPLAIESDVPADLAPDISATLSEDGRWLTLFAVNDQPTAQPRSFDFSAFKASNSAEITTLADTQQAGDSTVTNSFDSPRRVFPRKSKVSLATNFTYAFPPLSLTVIRIKVAPR